MNTPATIPPKSTDLADFSNGGDMLSPLGSVAAFGQAIKMATFLAESDLIPDAFKKKPSNIVLAIDIAQRLGAGLFAVMQSLHIIHGKPGFSAQFLIATLNASKRFTDLDYVYEGEGDTRTCFAFATHIKSNKERRGTIVSIKMAKAEGWFQKSGSKWQTMPDVMLAYRAAAFFVRMYAPDVSLGLYTADEISDMSDDTVRPSEAAATNYGVRAKEQVTDVIDGQIVDHATGEILNRGKAATASTGAADKAGSGTGNTAGPDTAAKATAPEAAGSTQPEKTPGPAAEPAKGDPTAAGAAATGSGDASIGPLTTGMQKMVDAAAARAGLKGGQIALRFGKPIHRGTLNELLKFLQDLPPAEAGDADVGAP